ncbi:MAG: homoserine dehydrogenase [Gudongella sp.]|nr:homoserine dehydrogenase [Gudongella sp.]
MINIGLLGLGTVGQGVVNILSKKRDELEIVLGDEISIKRILVRDLEKNRDVEVEPEILTLNPLFITEDEDIDVVVEVTGDVELSYKLIKRAMENGKHVVTANKAVVSAYFEELSYLAEKNEVYFLYEASVGGGIPVLKPLKDQIQFNSINKVQGILNGTCNFILTKMSDEGLGYDEVLKEAQELGYAEADPAADVEGLDTMRKLRILSTLALGASITEDDIVYSGIDKITAYDISLLAKKNRRVKLIGEAVKNENGYSAVVWPKAVSGSSPLKNVDGAFNSVLIEGDISNTLNFYGPGAGMYPTANAIWTDIIDCVLEKGSKLSPLKNNKIEKDGQVFSRFYLRVSDYKAQDWLDFSDIIDEELENNKDLAIITKKVTLDKIVEKLAELRDDRFALIAYED